MAVETQSGTPETITAGDTTRYTVSDSDHPATAWTMVALFSPVTGEAGISVTATASGSDHLVVIIATESGKLTAGDVLFSYRYTETASGEVETGQAGSLRVLQDPSKPRVKSVARQTLDAANEALKTLAGRKNATVSVSGQNYTFRNLDELLRLRDRMQSIVDAEEKEDAIGNGTSRSTGIGVRFKCGF